MAGQGGNVTPYNAQVNALREALPDAIRVGTVDKFQGQEAPVCLVGAHCVCGCTAVPGSSAGEPTSQAKVLTLAR